MNSFFARESIMSKPTLSPVAVFHIAPWGDDIWSGRSPEASESDGPWATLSGARDAMRRMRRDGTFPQGGVTVSVHDGTYELAECLVFEPEDSGGEGAPVRFVAAPGASPVISGGRRIEGWSEVNHNGLRCWMVDLPEVASGDWKFTRLYVNNQERLRPRLPKNGFTRFTGIAGLPDSGFRWNQGPDRAEFAPGDIRPWHNWQDAELVTYQLWFETRHRFRQIDEAAGVVHFEGRSIGSLVDESGLFARYFVENIFEALDTPGEWYLDRVAGRLYYLPLANESLEFTVVFAPKLTAILRFQGGEASQVRHLHFEHLAFAHQQWDLPTGCSGYIQAAFGVPGAVILEGADRCVFYRCRVAHINGYGIEVLRGSTANTFAACTIHDAGGGGVKIGHEELHGHDSALGETMDGEFEPIETTVVDCTIRDCGHLFPSAIGIWVGNSGWNRLLHNHIFDCNYTGISCGWQWGYAPTKAMANRIEFNHIHHINHREVLSDNGGIYTLGVQPGTTLIGNRIHDISCHHYGAWGIYPDEGSSEMRVERNLVSGTKKAAYSIHYGRDNLVQNNIFALSEEGHLQLGKREQHRSCLFRRNAVVALNGRVFSSVDRPDLPAHYTMQDNLYWALDGSPCTFNGLTLEDHRALGQNTGALVVDPLFADPEGGDYSLRADSPLFQTGFKAFDWMAAGPRFGEAIPETYEDYLARHPLPPADIPVIQTIIEVDFEGQRLASGDITFRVTVKNLGRREGSGNLILKAGPIGQATVLGESSLDYALAPGAEIAVPVTVRAFETCDAIWLETEPLDELAVPIRKVLFDPALDLWKIPGGWGEQDVGSLPEALSVLPERPIVRRGRAVAGVRMAAGNDSLLFHAHFHETELRPNLDMPWSGTAMEIIAFQTGAKKAYPTDQNLPKSLVALVPSANAEKLEAVHLAPGADTPVPAPAVRTAITPLPAGYSLSAIIPWKLLGLETCPEKICFDVVADVVDRPAGSIVQAQMFDLPCHGWDVRRGHLEVVSTLETESCEHERAEGKPLRSD